MPVQQKFRRDKNGRLYFNAGGLIINKPLVGSLNGTIGSFNRPICEDGTTDCYQPPPKGGVPDMTTTMPPDTGNYSDTAVEEDYYGVGCTRLTGIIAYIQNKLGTSLSAAASNYYNNKLSQATTAAGALGCNNNTGSGSGTGAGSGSGGGDVKPIVDKVVDGITTALGIAPAGSGGSSGSTDEAAKKKNLWWLWAICIGVVVIGIYQTSKE